MEDDAGLGRVGERPHWVRTGSVFVRAAHLLAASVVGGGLILGVRGPGEGAVRGWWILAGGSGALLLIAELLRHRELWRELCGWATFLKLALVAGIFLVPSGASGTAAGLMCAAFVVAVLGAHFPKRWRHRKLF